MKKLMCSLLLLSLCLLSCPRTQPKKQSTLKVSQIMSFYVPSFGVVCKKKSKNKKETQLEIGACRTQALETVMRKYPNTSKVDVVDTKGRELLIAFYACTKERNFSCRIGSKKKK